MEHKVKGCETCVFTYDGYLDGSVYCAHPSVDRSKSIIQDDGFLLITPDFCPLKKEPITISIEL